MNITKVSILICIVVQSLLFMLPTLHADVTPGSIARVALLGGSAGITTVATYNRYAKVQKKLAEKHAAKLQEQQSGTATPNTLSRARRRVSPGVVTVVGEMLKSEKYCAVLSFSALCAFVALKFGGQSTPDDEMLDKQQQQGTQIASKIEEPTCTLPIAQPGQEKPPLFSQPTWPTVPSAQNSPSNSQTPNPVPSPVQPPSETSEDQSITPIASTFVGTRSIVTTAGTSYQLKGEQQDECPVCFEEIKSEAEIVSCPQCSATVCAPCFSACMQNQRGIQKKCVMNCSLSSENSFVRGRLQLRTEEDWKKLPNLAQASVSQPQPQQQLQQQASRVTMPARFRIGWGPTEVSLGSDVRCYVCQRALEKRQSTIVGYYDARWSYAYCHSCRPRSGSYHYIAYS